MCGVDVLDKGCGGIHVQVYVGCRVFEVVKSYLCVSVPVLDEFTPAVLRTVRLQIVVSLVPWNSKAVGSAPDQTATFPEKSLVRLLAVVVGVGVRVVGVSLALYLHATNQPTNQQSNQPTNQTTDQPTNQPSCQPTDRPTK